MHGSAKSHDDIGHRFQGGCRAALKGRTIPVVAQPSNRGLAMAVLKKFPRFYIQFISLNSRTVALKSQIKFLRSFVCDLNI